MNFYIFHSPWGKDERLQMWDEDPLPWRYIAKALEVEPTNPTYLALRLQHPVAYH